MTTATNEPPVLSYPVKDYWRVYTLTVTGDPNACTGGCRGCNKTSTHCLMTKGGYRRMTMPEAVRGMIPAESRDWLTSGLHARRVPWQVLAGCECDPDFVSRKIAEAWASHDALNTRGTPPWTIFDGLCRNVYMDRDCQLRFAHDVLFSGRDEVTVSGQVEAALGHHALLENGELPARALTRRDILPVLSGMRLGALSHPDVLKAVLSADGSGFSPGLSDEVRLVAEILEPFDLLLESWTPGLSARLPLGFRSALMHCRLEQAQLFIDLLLAGDVLAPVPVHALQGVLDLARAAEENQDRRDPCGAMEKGMKKRLIAVLDNLGMLDHGDVSACLPRPLRLKLQLRKGECLQATERLLVASKSWGKISIRDRKWMEIPVTADPGWVRKEPLHA